MKGPAKSGLILIVIIAVVVGVAWLRSAQKDAPAVKDEAIAALPEAVAEPQGSTVTAPVKKGELCPEPPPSSRSTTPPAQSEQPPAEQKETPSAVKIEATAEPPGENRPAETQPETKNLPQTAGAVPATPAPATPTAAASTAKLPRVVDLGADKCKACKELAPILVELRKEYTGRVTVDFIDVWKNPKAGDPYKIRVIPTQVFFDRDGKEVWRHEGFLPKADFIAKFKELGVK